MGKIYSYAEYLPIAKVGDVVRAVVGRPNECSWLKTDGSNTQEITEVGDDFFKINGCYHDGDKDFFLELVSSTIRIPTWETIQPGDQIELGGGGKIVDKRTILEVGGSGKNFLISRADNQTSPLCWWGLDELQKAGWSLVTPEVEEMTLETVNKLLGKKVKIVE